MHPHTLRPPNCTVPAKLFLLIAAILLLHSCQEEPQLWKVDSQEQVIADYIASNPDEYSEFDKLIELTGMNALLRIRGPYTLFLPTDEAMWDYYMTKDVSSLEDFSSSFLEELILTHLVAAEIGVNDIGLGALREINALGDYLASEFLDSDIIISKSSTIIKRDIRAANGFIHVIDKVLDPVKQDIYDVVLSDPSYSIFSEGLALTGLKDTLQMISFPYGNGVARTRFTVLAVADTTFQRYGINSVDDLIEWSGGHPDSLTYVNNQFYRYIEYHCLNGSYYLSDLNTGIYPILSRDNNLAFTIDSDYKINFDRQTDQYTGFIIPASNTPAKNGVVHLVNDILPAIEPEPATVIFETTDFFDLKQGDYYQNHFHRWFDGENTFAEIKWNATYMLYYFHENNSALMSRDCLSALGWWSISITFPKVMKGKYEVYIFQPGWHDVTNCVATIDGVATSYIYEGNYGGTGGRGGLQKIGDVDFQTTTEHTITLRNISDGMVFWDYVVFEPVTR